MPAKATPVAVWQPAEAGAGAGAGAAARGRATSAGPAAAVARGMARRGGGDGSKRAMPAGGRPGTMPALLPEPPTMPANAPPTRDARRPSSGLPRPVAASRWRQARGGRAAGVAAGLAAALALVAATAVPAAAPGDAGLPPTLHATGLYAPGSTTELRAGILPYTPVYPLWSDGAAKRRWMWLPPGRAIDGSRPDAFDFPRGTRLWKEFAVDGRRVETRFIERRADGRWVFATYRWNAQGTAAVLAPAAGGVVAVAGAPGGRYELPSRTDCLACHEGAAVPVLGVSALQLSPDRDPLAQPAEAARDADADLRSLVARGLVRGLPEPLRTVPPRIAAASPTERAALGYLHGNCGHCHNDNGAPVTLVLAQQAAAPVDSRERVLQTTVGVAARLHPTGAAAPVPRIAAGRPENSLLLQRMRSRHTLLQMPPLGTRAPDPDGLALVERWITHDLVPPPPTPKEP